MEDGNEKKPGSRKKCLMWTKRTLLERYLILACLILFIVFLAMIGVVIYLEHSHRHHLVCKSAICHAEAGHILSGINISVNPCEDFHNFACGSIEKYRRIAEDNDVLYSDINRNILIHMKETLENDEDLDEPDFVHKVKLFYRSCMNRPTRAGEIIPEFLKVTKFNVWPLHILQQGYVPTLEQRLATATMLDIKNPYFAISPSLRDYKKISVYRGIFLISTETMFSSEEKNLKRMRMYKHMLAYALSSIGISWEKGNLLIEDLIELETKLLMIPYERNYTIETTFKKLEEICPMLKWTKIWKIIYDYYKHSDEYNEEYPITVQNINYIKKMCEILEDSDPRIVHDFLVWKLLHLYLMYFDAHFKELFEETFPIPPEEKEPTVEWEYCIDKLRKNTITPGLEYLMIKRMNDENLLKEARMYVEELINVMDDIFLSENWLVPYRKAKEKLQSLEWVIGYLNTSIDEDSLSKTFELIDVTESYVENILLDQKYRFRIKLFNDTEEFSLSRILQEYWRPKAFYGNNNRIEISLGHLTSPFLVLGVPRYMNYGGIGFVIAHEIMHAFDIIDSDKHYKIDKSFWPNSTIEAFEGKQQCLIDQYSQFPIDSNGTKLDGFRTKAENTADNGALLPALKAYEKFLLQNGEEPRLPGLDFTNQQMFFIRYAQTYCNSLLKPMRYEYKSHSPGKYRIIAPLQNLQQFSEAFNCPVGSPMNPKDKCKIWG